VCYSLVLLLLDIVLGDKGAVLVKGVLGKVEVESCLMVLKSILGQRNSTNNLTVRYESRGQLKDCQHGSYRTFDTRYL